MITLHLSSPHRIVAVVPAKAGTHIPEPVVMGPRLRGDDRECQLSLFNKGRLL